MAQYERDTVGTLAGRMEEPRRLIQMLIGPRQSGKSTAIRQALAHVDLPRHVALASIDNASRDWLRAQWAQARTLAASGPCVLVIDEVQMVDQWSAVVKELWDEDSWSGIDLRVVLSGSSSLLLQKGLAEGLTGRFEVIHSTHWSLRECEDAFGYTLDDFLFFGGYPGGAPLRFDRDRWLAYIVDAVIEPSISRDVIAFENVRKPNLMRRLFHLGAAYSGQELSYRKMLGQLDDAGNTTTLAHYLDLLDDACLLAGLQKYDRKSLRSRASSPRLMVYDTSLMTATYGRYRDFLLEDPERRGRLVESAVGAWLLADSRKQGFELYWWRDGDAEVDFVAASGSEVTAIEVKSGRVKSLRGMTAFVNVEPSAGALAVGSPECPVDRFLRGEIPIFRH